MADVLEPRCLTRSGYRLHRLEVYNWGTFDSAGESTRGSVYKVEPSGETTLLIGKNGSGKSTLVDALLTLLVRPAVRNYNVAAGAKKRERDERTYVKGAYDRRSRDDDNRAEVQFLRPHGSQPTVLLACFSNADTQRVFTIAQVMYVAADGSIKKVYCFAPEERSIAGDCSGLRSMDRLQQQMRDRGFRTTKSYAEYHEWFRKATGVQPKAMDMLNQTVAVKDIQRLNDFIREHMLEARPWGEKVDTLLGHFTQLSAAHQSLVRVRRQFQLLEPIEEQGQVYRDQAVRLERTERALDAADSYFRHKVVELFTPEIELRRDQLGRIRTEHAQLADEIERVQDECRRLTNDIENAGGARFREIALLIKAEDSQAAVKRATHQRFHEALRDSGVEAQVSTAAVFAAVRDRWPLLRAATEHATDAADARNIELRTARGELLKALESDERELAALEQRHGNLPEWAAELRRRLCDQLDLPLKDLPFAAELIAVRSSERTWEASIEMVLHTFALSLLVPESHYRLMSAYVEQSRLVDGSGRGQRLVYLKVNRHPPADSLDPKSLVAKLEFREGSPLAPWVKAELARRFNYRCCDTLEEFQQDDGPALTPARHVKVGHSKDSSVRHTKDDRDRVADPRHFVLGWDNTDKKRRIADDIRSLRGQVGQLDAQIAGLTEQLAGLRVRQAAIAAASQIADFAAIDFMSHEAQAAALRLEQQQLESQSDTLRLLKQRLGEKQAHGKALQLQRDGLLKAEGELAKSIADNERELNHSRDVLHKREGDRTLRVHSQSFAALDADFAERPLTCADLLARESASKEAYRLALQQARAAIEPIQSEVVRLMGKFLREFPDERADLNPDVAYLDSFLGLLREIRAEDLPRHEQRFKERLNDKVTREIGLLNGELQRERSAIEDKIELLNEALAQLEYRPGTHMRLEAKLVRDREIAEFREALAECLSGTFAGTPAADEARFVEIEKFIKRLQEEERWRNKVTDVRRWFDFAARELDQATGEERGYYEDSTGQSGGEKAKLAFTILVAAIAYQYDIDPTQSTSDRFHFVIVDEMFSKVDDQYSEYALELFRKFGLQLLIVAPLDAKARVTEPYVGCYLLVSKGADSRSVVHSMTAREFEDHIEVAAGQSSELVGTNGVRRRPR
jgi:uncharacterized protein YPO0396